MLTFFKINIELGRIASMSINNALLPILLYAHDAHACVHWCHMFLLAEHLYLDDIEAIDLNHHLHTYLSCSMSAERRI